MREAASFIASRTGSGPVGLVPSILQSVTDAVQAWGNRRKVARLFDADDHMLEDIGISRHELRRALDLPFAYDPSRELQRIATRRLRGWQER